MKRTVSNSIFVVFSLILLGAAGCTSPAPDQAQNIPVKPPEFVLVKEGMPQAAVIRNPQADAAQKALIREAAKCGVKMELVEAAQEDGNKIVFDVRESALEEEDAFTIEFPDETTMKIVCTPVSARWAVNHLLETAFGVKWIFPHLKEYGEEINDYPKAENITVKAEKYVQKPYSYYLDREMVWQFGSWTVNLGNKREFVENHWITIDGFPVWKYAPDQSWPKEILPVRNGKRLTLPKPKSLPIPKNPYLARNWVEPNPLDLTYFNNWNPCFSHPKSAEIAAANILEALARDPKKKIFVLSVNDNGGFCECETCSKAVEGRRNFSGYLNYSDVFWGWMNKVAEIVSKKHPDVWLTASGYREVMEPPSFRLHPRIVVKFAFDIHAMNDAKVRETRLAQMKSWAERCSHLIVYDYDYGKNAFLFPRLTLRLHAEMIRRFHRDFNTRGLSTEALFLPFDGPKYHLKYRLMRDVASDPEEIADTWYRDAVGPEAAPALRKYFQFWEDYWMGEDIRKTQWYRSVTNVYMQLGEKPTHTFALKPGDMKKLRALMTEVVKKADTPQRKRRAQVLMKYFEYAEAAAQALFSELISPEGKLQNAAEAVELLKQVPDAIEAEKRFREHPYNALAGMKPEHIESYMFLNIGLVMPFVKDPAVRAELQKLENDMRLPPVLRSQIKIWLGVRAENLIENGSFEQEAVPFQPLWMPKLKGGRNKEHASDGQYAFRTENGYYLLTPKMEPGKTYLFLCDVYIERGSNEGRFAINLAPSKGITPKTWLRNEFVLSGGQWNTFSLVVSHPREVDNLQIQLGFRKFESGEPVWIDNLRFYSLDDFVKADSGKEKPPQN